MILWEEESLNDREKIFEFLYDFNPDAAEKTDNLIEANVENLLEQLLMGVQRDGVRGRLLIIPEISMIVSYWIEGDIIRIMRASPLEQFVIRVLAVVLNLVQYFF
ncbi:type II toxin-antitoxin system RelE/ParE family toxin [Vibrio parahaemolyticus]|nr:type II toxin-antitoxin system RelE/ParE family toxin [Vibrio parahaemolyticus]